MNDQGGLGMTGKKKRKIFKNKILLICVVFVVAVALSAIFAKYIAPYDPDYVDIGSRLLPVGSQGHILGTDNVGRDILSRLIYGARISLIAGIVPSILAMLIGAIIGLISGYIGGMLDNIIMRIVDIMLAFPFMLLALVLVTVLGPSLQNAVLAVMIATVPRNIRLVRGEALSLKEREFINACRILGYGKPRILLSELFPNVFATAATIIVSDISLMIQATAGLSFLGLGVQPPISDWGSMVNEGRAYLNIAPNILLAPCTLIALVCFSFAIIGDELYKKYNPQLSKI
ncbi:MAG: ABC transporter permease [Actinobacteria bacterium]|nr:ABC transporter permease [Actinomycetota bacterium]